MPTFDDSPRGNGSSGFKGKHTQEMFRFKKGKSGVVFSANGSFNPTNLAVENSLKEIFDQFHTMVTGELKQFDLTEDDDKPFF